MLNNVTTNKRAKLTDAMRSIGNPHTSSRMVTQENRHHFRRFLTSLGIPSDKASGMKMDTLSKAYNRPNYLMAILWNASEQSTDSLRASEVRHRAMILHNAAQSAYDIDPDLIGFMAAAEKEISKHDGQDTGQPIQWKGPSKVKVAKIDPKPDTAPEPAKPEPQTTDTTPDIAKPKTDDEIAAAVSHLVAAMKAGQTPAKAELDENRVIELIQAFANPKPSLSTIKVEVVQNGQTKKLDGVQHHIFPDVLKSAAAGVNVMLVGPAGAGKTTLAEQVAEALERPFHFNGALTSEYKLSGFIDAQGRVISTPFREAYLNGGVFLFDEIDASLPAAVLAFNAALANGHADFPDGNKSRHPDFVAIAAANTYGRGADREYVGRFQLDAASLDRFAILDMDYDEGMELQLSENEDWTRYVQSVRKAVFNLKLRHVVSPRASINGAKLLAQGISKETVANMVIWKGIEPSTINKIKAAM